MSSNITVTMPDNSTREYPMGTTTGTSIAEDISKSLAKQAVAVKINGKLCDMSLPIEEDCSIEIVKRDSEEGLELIRHDAAHVMAEAVQNLFPRHSSYYWPGY